MIGLLVRLRGRGAQPPSKSTDPAQAGPHVEESPTGAALRAVEPLPDPNDSGRAAYPVAPESRPARAFLLGIRIRTRTRTSR